jgi:hypothetical protein
MHRTHRKGHEIRETALRALGGLALLVGLLSTPGSAQAQETYSFTVAGLGSVGGSLDAEPGDDLSNTGYQVNLGMVTDSRTHVAVRVGQLGLDQDELFGSLREAELTYATFAGEYRFNEGWYDSGIYLGLGGYRLEGVDLADRGSEDTAVGLAIGFTGEFKVNRWLGVLLELSGHWADFEESQIFGMAHGGLAVHF